jgi:hypothetical protein
MKHHPIVGGTCTLAFLVVQVLVVCVIMVQLNKRKSRLTTNQGILQSVCGMTRNHVVAERENLNCICNKNIQLPATTGKITLEISQHHVFYNCQSSFQ